MRMRWVTVILAVVAVVAVAGGLRTWTSASGVQVEAEFVQYQAGTVYLTKADGQTLGVAFNALSQQDRDYVTQAVQASQTTRTPATTSSSSRRTETTSSPERRELPRGVLTEEQVAALKEKDLDDKGYGYVFQATFGVDSVKATGPDRARFVKKGAVPFRVTCALYRAQGSTRGQARMTLESGMARIYIQDADGNVVVNVTENLNKLCPTWGGRGGYFGEVAKAGQYTVVAYVDKGSKGMFGKKLTANLAAVR